jgi:lysophospholipase L1-like esterase
VKRVIPLVTVMLVPIGLCALLEATVRMTSLEQTAIDRMTERLYPVAPGKEEGLFSTRVYDPLLSWRLRPGGWLPGRIGRINSQGLVGAEFSWRKPAHTFRILSLGDSVTYGLYACGVGIFCRHDPYPSALENLLNQRPSSDRFEVLDAGVYGYATLQGLAYYRVYLTGLDEDLVTIMFGWNDHGVKRGAEAGEFRSAWMRDLAYGAYRLAFFRTAAAWTAVWVTPEGRPNPFPSGGYQPRTSPADFERNLALLVEAVRARGAKAVLLTEPFGPLTEPLRTGAVAQPWVLNLLPDYQTYVGIHRAYNERTRAVAGRLGVPLVDAEAEFERSDKARLFSPFDLVHPNDTGYRLIAEMLLAVLEHDRLIPDRPAP